MKIALLLAVIALSLLFEGFFSGSEIAVVSCNRIKVKILAEGGVRRASLVLKLLKKPEHILATTLIGTNISVIVSSFAANELFAALVGRRYSGLAIIALVPAVLIVGETIPKSISRNNAEIVALLSAYPLLCIMRMLYPFISLSASLATMILGKERAQTIMKSPFATRDELRIILSSEKSLQGRFETIFMKRVLNLATALVRDHMTPLSKTVSLSQDSPVKEAVKIIAESGFSRIPVFDGVKENIVGIIHARDLLEREDADETVRSRMTSALIVDEDARIQNVLQEFQQQSSHLAIVQNSQRRITGIITLEDIVEEIVGEIFDEFDEPPPQR